MRDRLEKWCVTGALAYAARLLIVCVAIGGVAVVAGWCSGCGAGAFATHVQVAAGFEDSARETAQLVRAYRTAEMRQAAREVHDAGGTLDEAIAAARARGAELGELVEAQRLYAIATHSYVDALWIAEHSREGLKLSSVMDALRDLVDAYRHLRELGGEAGLEALARLPETPAWLDGAVPPQLLAQTAQEGGVR